MSKGKSFTIKIPKVAKRNMLIVAMRPQIFHHKAEAKGGDVNEQRDLLNQVDEEKDEDEQDY